MYSYCKSTASHLSKWNWIRQNPTLWGHTATQHQQPIRRQPKLLTFKFNTRTCWVKPVWLRLATLVASVALTLSPSIVVLNQAKSCKVPVCWIWSQVSLVFCELNARATIGINEIHLKPLNTWHLNNFFPHHGTNPPFFQTCAAVFFVCALVQPISSN